MIGASEIFVRGSGGFQSGLRILGQVVSTVRGSIRRVHVTGQREVEINCTTDMNGLCGLLEGSLSDISTSDEDEIDQDPQTTTDGPDSSNNGGCEGAHAVFDDVSVPRSLLPRTKTELNLTSSTTGDARLSPVITEKIERVPMSALKRVSPMRSVVDLSERLNTEVTSDCNIETPLPADSVETVPV